MQTPLLSAEADETWPQIVADAAKWQTSKTFTSPVRRPSAREAQAQPQGLSRHSLGQNRSRPVQSHPQKWATKTLGRIGEGWGTFRIIPMESRSRVARTAANFCTVTGFLRRLHPVPHQRKRRQRTPPLEKPRAQKKERGQIAVFFQSTTISPSISKRTKSFAAGTSSPPTRKVHWVAQISANLLRDEELVDLIAQSGGQMGFHRHGVHRPPPTSQTSTKVLNKPGEYAAVLQRPRPAQTSTPSPHSFFGHGQ